MKKWQYMIDTISNLSEMGQKGWELICPTRGSADYYIFKREIPQKGMTAGIEPASMERIKQ